MGLSSKIPIEVKTNEAKEKDLHQIEGYAEELSGECPAGVLVTAGFGRKFLSKANGKRVRLFRYALRVGLGKPATFEEICQAVVLDLVAE